MESRTDRRLGPWMMTSIVIGTIVGSGIFMLPAALAPLGPNAIAGWFVSGAGALAIAWALARTSSLSGAGIQANIEQTLGATVAFLVTWAFWVSNWAAQAAVAIAGASALAWIDPRIAGPDLMLPIAGGSLVLLTAVNALGVRAAGSLSIVTVAIKLLPLLAVILILGIHTAQGAAHEPIAPAPLRLGTLATATSLTFFALTGFEGATAPVDKVANPSRTIPLAILGGTAVVVLIYLLASTGVQLLLPATLAARSSAPFADVIANAWGDRVASAAAVAIAVAAFGCLNGLILATGELGYSMALRGDLPRIMRWTRGRDTPVGAQAVGSALSLLLIAANSHRDTASLFAFVILLSTAAVLLVYLTGALSAWRLNTGAAPRAIAGFALLFVLFALYGAGAEPDLWCVALLGGGAALREVMHRIGARSPVSRGGMLHSPR